MGTIKSHFNRKYFGKSFPLEYRIYMIFFFEALVLSVLSATTNTLLGKGIMGVSVQWAVIVFFVIVLFIPVQKRQNMQKPLLLFMSFVYIPFLYFQTAGYDGTALFFSLLAIFLLAIVFKGKQRVVIIALNIAVLVGCCLVEYFNPGLIVPHDTAFEKLVDLIVALILATGGLAILSVYISNAYEEERNRIKMLMNEDALTGAYARRYLYEQLPREMSQAHRTNKPLAVLLFDLDYFKTINDTYGHTFGDEVLHTVAKVITKELRPYDIFARYGGEEFVVVLPGTPYDEAMTVAERLREAVEILDFENHIAVTISVGLAVYRPDDSLDSLIERADEQLYEAKRAGRNRCCGSP